MKNYKMLSVPEDSAWERFTIRRYLPIWLLEITDGIANVFAWLPTIYKDRHWDSSYIYEVLKKKIELQRKYIVSSNRHLSVPNDNYFMTVCLNLIERCQEDYYAIEYLDYHTSKFHFIPCNEEGEDTNLVAISSEEVLYRLDTTVLTERYDEYLAKYRLSAKKMLKKDPTLSEDKGRLCFLIAQENQNKCKELLFKILNNNIERWWE